MTTGAGNGACPTFGFPMFPHFQGGGCTSPPIMLLQRLLRQGVYLPAKESPAAAAAGGGHFLTDILLLRRGHSYPHCCSGADTVFSTAPPLRRILAQTRKSYCCCCAPWVPPFRFYRGDWGHGFPSSSKLSGLTSQSNGTLPNCFFFTLSNSTSTESLFTKAAAYFVQVAIVVLLSVRRITSRISQAVGNFVVHARCCLLQIFLKTFLDGIDVRNVASFAASFGSLHLYMV